MPWWSWVLIWVVLVLGALGFFALMGLQLWRQTKALFKELETAGERFALISEQLETLSGPPAEPAVFDDVARLRAERERALRLAKARTSIRMRERQARLTSLSANGQPKGPVAISEQRVR